MSAVNLSLNIVVTIPPHTLMNSALPASQLDITNAILQSVGQTPWSNPNLHRRYSMLTDL